MIEDKLHPQIKSDILKLPSLPISKLWALPITRFVYNIFAATKASYDDVEISENSFPHGKYRHYEPAEKKSDGCIIWMFGGGHLLGKPNHLDRIASKVAKEVGVTVIAPHYRLSPANPFPADLDDCFNVWKYVNDNPVKFAIDAHKMVIAGHSAGGGLAAGLTQRICDQEQIKPLAQCLFYPMLDDRTATNDELGNDFIVWTAEHNRVAWSAYLNPKAPGEKTVPEYAAPARRDNLSGLPESWIGICDLDLFAQENRDYANRLQTAGVACEVYSQAGAPHAFESLVLNAEISKAFEASAISFLQRVLVG